MKDHPLFAGRSQLKKTDKKVTGSYVTIGDEQFYKIANFDRMPPFFMSIVSDSDHWMYIWSNGPLSAGRKNADNALFPYYTDDKIKDSAEITGSKTIIHVQDQDGWLLWEPFSDFYRGIYNTERNCYKNIYGNKLIFEEINHDLQLTFRYAWMNSEDYGFIKKSTILNTGKKLRNVNILDGIQNILPHGVDRNFQNEYSTLVDAYKKCELEDEINLGIYALSSIPVDRAEPSEALKATVVWSAGVKAEAVLISSRQLDDFRLNGSVIRETDVRAARGAYFVNQRIDIMPDAESVWYIAADVNKGAAEITALKRLLKESIISKIEKDIQTGTEKLLKIIANADGLQKSGDILSTSRHFSNVLFNVMRGGIFSDGYTVDSRDFLDFLAKANTSIHSEFSSAISNLPATISRDELHVFIKKQNTAGLEKLFYEYLPLTFSRRHGDPSRPWNRFSIDIKGEHGEKVLNYEGNWRDIFQNWEALAMSFPEYLSGMITRFVNASTADGYNPYRLTRDGTDWETLDPSDPWAYIGYWGDHQIIYLLKLLELSKKFQPDSLEKLLHHEIFVYTHVPYRIKSYDAILKDPFNTVDFDDHLDARIKERVKNTGSDGQLITISNGDIYHVNLTEKLLVPVLTKLSNFIPEAGIWMNTQRPEWNDANNALVGNGISMVTLYYLRRHLTFLLDIFKSENNQAVKISDEVVRFFDKINNALASNSHLLKSKITDFDRKSVLDLLGHAGSEYRTAIYDKGFSAAKTEKQFSQLAEFCRVALNWIDHTIRANKREDNLYHAYNLIQKLSNDRLSIRYLYEMLEGQVAVLSCGLLKPKDVVKLLDALRNSSLYREDQSSYILYPNRRLARFTEKNNIPADAVKKSQLLQKLAKKGDQKIIIKDIAGYFHFNGDYRNAALLKEALQKIDSAELLPLVEKEQEYILDLYESIFDHQSFTGRSGTFFKYEGLGSIYWHMVSKLLLAVQENYFNALSLDEDAATLKSLKTHYYDIRYGIGATKSPDVYGAFPTDPYSHTPQHAGTQQPGMTGQVKEDILSRYGELGVFIEDGSIKFSAKLLRRNEFLTQAESFRYYDVFGNEMTLNLDKDSLAFTFCQTPVVYHKSSEEKISISFKNKKSTETAGLLLDKAESDHIFKRDGYISRIDVYLGYSE